MEMSHKNHRKLTPLSRLCATPSRVMPLLAALAAAVWAPQALAQVTGGQLLQQTRELAPTAPVLPEAVPDLAPESTAAPAPKPDETTFVVKRFVFAGNTQISTAALQALVADRLDQPLSFDGVQRVADLVAEYYRGEGWLARAVLPRQDVTDGTVTIEILEAKLGEVKVDNQSQKIPSERVQAWIYQRLPQGSALSLTELDRAVLSLNDVPGVSAPGALEQGAEPGTTDLRLTVTDRAPYSGQVSVDSFGDRSSGRMRTSALVNANGLLQFGDQLSWYGMYSLGNAYGRLGYTMPVDDSGLRVGANISSMAYSVLGPSFAALSPRGVANTAGLEASYPLLRSRPANVTLLANLNYSDFRNWTNTGPNEDQTYHTSVLQVGASGNLLDGFYGGGLTTASLTGSVGEIARDPAGQYDSNYHVGGSFLKLRYAINRTQALTEDVSVYASFSGQRASRNMDSSEQMYVGGPTNVRAYGSGQGAATQGHLLTLELRKLLPYRTELAAFYDAGWVETWKFNNPAVNGVDNRYMLQGVGTSVTWTGPYNLTLKATWAHRFGPLADSVSAYFDQGGALNRDRLWLNASLPF